MQQELVQGLYSKEKSTRYKPKAIEVWHINNEFSHGNIVTYKNSWCYFSSHLELCKLEKWIGRQIILFFTEGPKLMWKCGIVVKNSVVFNFDTVQHQNLTLRFMKKNAIYKTLKTCIFYYSKTPWNLGIFIIKIKVGGYNRKWWQ